jgi:mannose-6-phosphate isomerase
MSNSHMHLLEAALAWLELDSDHRWLSLATQIVELALTRYINSRTGAIGEYFTGDWQPLDSREEIVEPGHQFEWATLLLKFARNSSDARLAPAALRLVAFGESRGVDRQRRVVINRCFADGRPDDADARLWPQTERIRASCAAAEASGDAMHLLHALDATQTLLRYFATPLHGLWRDRLNAANEFVVEPAPASSLYHIVGAGLALGRVCNLQ